MNKPPEAVALPRTHTWFGLAESLACAALGILLLAKGIIPAWNVLQTDFPNYYLAARLLREGYSLDRLYDWVWLQRIKDHWGIDQPLVGFAGLTPFSALPILPLSVFSALTAKRIWLVVNLALLGATVELSCRVTALGRRRTWLLCLLCVFPLRTSFLFGQMHLLVFFLLVCAFALSEKQRTLASAVCLSLAGMLKIYPILFVLYFAWKRQWMMVLAMGFFTLILCGASLAIFGANLTHAYWMEVLPRSLMGEILDPYSAHSGSMSALFHRLFIYEPQLNPLPWQNSPFLYSILYPTWQIAVLAPFFALVPPRTSGKGTRALEWAAWVFALLLLSPVPSSYHFVVMAFCICLLADFLLAQGQPRLLAVAIGLYCLVSVVEFIPRSLISGSGVWVPFARLWVAIAFWLLLLLCLWKHRGPRLPLFQSPVQAIVLCLAAGLLWSLGAANDRRHFASLRQDVQRRLPVPSPAYLSSEPRSLASGYGWTAMLGPVYRIIDDRGKPLRNDPAQGAVDELSFATDKTAQVVLIEQARQGGSRLLRMSIDHPSTEDVLLQDAEFPAISEDGATVAFLREVKGRGSLWLGALALPSDAPARAQRRLTPDDYDVRSFALAPSGFVIFAAEYRGQTHLFRLSPGHEVTSLLPEIPDVASPAISRDERFLAFTLRVHNRWQLVSWDRHTGQRQMLTQGDCNAYSPQWMDASRLFYATDCGRGLGLTALATVTVEH
jgi:hypothetical protein